jgi:UDP-GlcNAc:undecaprenyl-phosphate/decaprenyl-phosphate GlcNAc-1-phosphate transferase
MTAFLIVFVLALGATVALVPLLSYVGVRYGIAAKAGGRRQSESDRRGVSKLGGLALVGGFMVAALAAQFLPVPRLDGYEIIRFSGLMLGLVVITVFGIIDDKFELKALPQFIGQSLATGIAILFQIFIEYFNNPLTGQQTDPFPYFVTVTISYFWLMILMNTMNFLDGLDGLAGGVAVIASIVLFVNGAFRLGQTSVSLLHVALLGASVGFTLYNFFPARIFMGSGAVALGYLLGCLSIIGGAKMATILFVLGLPLVDAAWQAFNRLLHGRSPFEGDRGHLHFRLVDMGFGVRQIVLGYYAFCAFFGILTLVVESQLFKFVALAVMILLVMVGSALVVQMRHTVSSSSSSSSSSS